MNKTIKRIFSSYFRTTWILKSICVVIFWIFIAILASIEPLIFTEFIKKIEIYISTGTIDMNEIISLSLIWWVFAVVYIIGSYCFDYFFLAKTIIAHYHKNTLILVERISHMSYGNYLWRQIWSLYKVLDRGTESQLFFLYSTLLGVLRSFVSIIFISTILFIVDWRMAIATLILVPVAISIGYYIYAKLAETQKNLDLEYIKGFWILWNSLTNFWLTKTLHLEDAFYKKIKNVFDTAYTKQLKINRWWSIGHGYTAAIVIIARIIVIWVWLSLIVKGEIDFATLFLFFSYIGWIYFPIGFIFEQLRQFQKYLSAVEVMYDEVDAIEFENTNEWKNLTTVTWNIQFSNISFDYWDWNKILREVDFEIKPWQKIAFVGNTWAGKSTIVNLLLRFWDVTKWEILLDGVDITTLKKSSLRKHIWMVSQDNSLFNLSIEENLKLANPKATKSDIEAALKNAEAEFVYNLPNGIKTVIWERSHDEKSRESQ